MEKGLVVKKEIFIMKSKEDIHKHYDIDNKVTKDILSKLGKEPMGRYFWVDQKTNPILSEPSK